MCACGSWRAAVYKRITKSRTELCTLCSIWPEGKRGNGGQIKQIRGNSRCQAFGISFYIIKPGANNNGNTQCDCAFTVKYI